MNTHIVPDQHMMLDNAVAADANTMTNLIVLTDEHAIDRSEIVTDLVAGIDDCM